MLFIIWYVFIYIDDNNIYIHMKMYILYIYVITKRIF
jgi:hypothetical protein